MPTNDVDKLRLYRRRWYERNKKRQLQTQLRRKHELRRWISSLKVRCAACGEDHPGCLVFHHVDPSAKELTIAAAANSGWSKKRIAAEIDKCIVLCANCHAKRHWRLRLTVGGTTGSPKPE